MARRQAEGAVNGTINREVGVLLKLMHLAHEHNKLHRVPKIRTLKEAASRQGFFETDQFLAVRARLPEDLQVALSLAFELGWRMPSEVLTLERRQLDMAAGAIRLEPGSTKMTMAVWYTSLRAFGRCWRARWPAWRRSSGAWTGLSRTCFRT